jgi:hypothetical protein
MRRIYHYDCKRVQSKLRVIKPSSVAEKGMMTIRFADYDVVAAAAARMGEGWVESTRALQPRQQQKGFVWQLPKEKAGTASVK